MMGIWDFIQNQILGMRWLHDLVGAALSGLSLDINTKIGGSIHFFNNHPDKKPLTSVIGRRQP